MTVCATKAQCSWHKGTFASVDAIMLDFEVYQGANALSSQVEEAEGLGLGALVIECLCKTLHPGTKVYCDRFFTTMKAVDQMLQRQVYLTGTVIYNRIIKALQKLPSDKNIKTARMKFLSLVP